MTRIEAFAPAKINLTLHVTGRRDDGYHVLDSVVAFADVGDLVSATAAPDLSLAVTGPMRHGVPSDDRNLVLRAARAMGSATGAAITLHKVLPPASGIGGGSSDAAAALRVLTQLWSLGLPPDLMSLGADLPVCLEGRPCRMRGAGEKIGRIPRLPPLWAVLANPRIEVPTGQVFAALAEGYGAPMADTLPAWPTPGSLIQWLSSQRNDLEPPARALAPTIDDVLAALRGQAGCTLARMSGSGATCFGLFASRDHARAAARAIARGQPDWWVTPARLGAADIAPRVD